MLILAPAQPPPNAATVQMYLHKQTEPRVINVVPIQFQGYSANEV